MILMYMMMMMMIIIFYAVVRHISIDNEDSVFCIFGIQKASLNMLWEYSPSSANLASDWLRVRTALLRLRKKEK